jgi:glutaredoxin
MKTIWLAFCFLIAASGNVHGAGLYKWVDKNGKVHYGDQPAEDAIKPEHKKFSSDVTTSDDDLSYSTRKAKSEFPVTLYVAANCGDLCNQARSMLNKRGIPFAEKNLQTNEDITTFKTKYGGNSTPSLTVGKTLLSGFEATQWNSELDTAGYPKIAPYGVRPKKPAEVKPETPTEQVK